jgi:hypothetical protein
MGMRDWDGDGEVLVTGDWSRGAEAHCAEKRHCCCCGRHEDDAVDDVEGCLVRVRCDPFHDGFCTRRGGSCGDEGGGRGVCLCAGHCGMVS